MRKFIRHPSDIPLEYDLGTLVSNKKEYLNDISKSGLSFKSKVFLEPGSAIDIRILLRKSIFSENGIVIWCKEEKDYFNIGVEFKSAESDFRIRMVEQVCYIEQYKADILKKEGRTLSGEQAAIEWIQKYAKDFPN